MGVKKCPKCGGSWSSALRLCAFCGVEGIEESAPAPITLPAEQMKPPEPAPQPEKESTEVAVETAAPSSALPGDGAPEGEPLAAPSPEPVPEPPPEDDEPAPVEEPRPAAALFEKGPGDDKPPEIKYPPVDTPRRLAALQQGLTPMPGPGPKVPFSRAGVVFSLLGLLACLALPATVLFQGETGVQEWIGKIGPLVSGILAPFAAIGWILGARHEKRCRQIDTIPATSARFARAVGVVCTIILLFQASILLIVVGILRLTRHLPSSFLGPNG